MSHPRTTRIGLTKGDRQQMNTHSVRVLVVASVLAAACGAPDTASVDGQAAGALRAASATAVRLATIEIGNTTYPFRILRCDLSGRAEDGILLRGGGTPDGPRLTVEVERLSSPAGISGMVYERVTFSLLNASADGNRTWQATRSHYGDERWMRGEGREVVDGPLIRISGAELVAADIFTHEIFPSPERRKALTPAEQRALRIKSHATRPGTLRAACTEPIPPATR